MDVTTLVSRKLVPNDLMYLGVDVYVYVHVVCWCVYF